VPEAAPLFCGGITVFSPLCEFISRKEARVAVVGLGGLGHLAVKFSAAMGHEVSVFSHSISKEAEAKELGARNFHYGPIETIAKNIGRSFDMVLVTANADMAYSNFLHTLRADGTLCFVGIPPSPIQLPVGAMLGKRLRVAASPIGSPSQIMEMLSFCATHGILAKCEIEPMSAVNSVLERVRANKVRYRAVLAR
jgi:alcohol/geraniol dehydrogenase (NADP+)